MPIEATDLFTLGAQFSPQSSNSAIGKTPATAMDEKGDVACESMIGETRDFKNDFTYCGTDLQTDLALFLTKFGDVSNAKVVTGIQIDYEGGKQPRVAFTGVQYPAAVTAIQYADVSAAVPAAGGVTVPTLTGVTLGTAATPIGMSITLSLNHVAAPGADGEIFAAQNITFKAECSVDYLGVPTTYDPVTGWTTDNTDESDSNTDHDQATWSGHRYFAVI